MKFATALIAAWFASMSKALMRRRRAIAELMYPLLTPAQFYGLTGMRPIAGAEKDPSKKTVEKREQALALFKSATEKATELGLDADDPTKGTEADWKTVNDMFAAAKKLDDEFKVLAEREGIMTTMAERMDYYSVAVTGKGLGLHPIGELPYKARKSIGQQVIESDEYKELVATGALSNDNSNAPFRMKSVTAEKAADDVIVTGDGGGASSLVLPQYLPGIQALEQRPRVVRQLFSQAPTSSDLISYARQVGFERNATMVAQAGKQGSPAGTKPQSSISWERVTSPVETAATWMASTRQALADAGQIAALIDNQGRLMLELLEEEELLDGDGNSPDLLGVLHCPGVQTLDVGAADNLDAIRTARRLVRTGASRFQADGIVLNPIDSERFDLLKDLNGQYRGGNPIGNFGFNQPIWSLNRVESEAVEEGTALVGAFKPGATVYERQGITVYTSDSHADFFIKNLIAILFEERLGFAIFYPSAFVIVSLGDWDETSGEAGFVSE